MIELSVEQTSKAIKDRVQRALTLPPATLHGDLWIVEGTTRNYTVSLDHPNTLDGVSCNCPDREHFGRDLGIACKHIVRATIDNAKYCRRDKTSGAKIIRH